MPIYETFYAEKKTFFRFGIKKAIQKLLSSIPIIKSFEKSTNQIIIVTPSNSNFQPQSLGTLPNQNDRVRKLSTQDVELQGLKRFGANLLPVTIIKTTRWYNRSSNLSS